MVWCPVPSSCSQTLWTLSSAHVLKTLMPELRHEQVTIGKPQNAVGRLPLGLDISYLELSKSFDVSKLFPQL